MLLTKFILKKLDSFCIQDVGFHEGWHEHNFFFFEINGGYPTPSNHQKFFFIIICVIPGFFVPDNSSIRVLVDDCVVDNLLSSRTWKKLNICSDVNIYHIYQNMYHVHKYWILLYIFVFTEWKILLNWHECWEQWVLKKFCGVQLPHNLVQVDWCYLR